METVNTALPKHLGEHDDVRPGSKSNTDREPTRSALPSRTDISVDGYGICFGADKRLGRVWRCHHIHSTLSLRLDCHAMMQERPVLVERRLAAILAADVAGYSRLMHHEEEATHAKLRALLADEVAPAISEHGGRIVKNTGDGFLAEFSSAVQAVRAAIHFQTRVKELTAGDAEDRRIAFRV